MKSSWETKQWLTEHNLYQSDGNGQKCQKIVYQEIKANELATKHTKIFHKKKSFVKNRNHCLNEKNCKCEIDPFFSSKNC